MFWPCMLLLVVTAIATGLALLFLLQSIYPVESAITAPEPMLQAFAEKVRATELRGGSSPEVAAQKALIALKTLMAQQYGEAAARNRALNRLRASRRTRAGLAILISVLLVVILMGAALATHIGGGARFMSDKPASSQSGLPERVEYGFSDPRRYTTVPISADAAGP